MHNSPYPRNFLVQDGPIDATWEERKVKGVERKIFRLIDFGRSIDPQSRGGVNSKENEDETTYEETRVKQHFKVEDWANVSVSLGEALRDVLR
jgi:leucyl-tRNA synthetase